MTKFSLIIPVLNEANQIGACLLPLQMQRGQALEIIVVDGGSKDRTASIAAELADKVITAQPGRAIQMNAGARQATGAILAFLHVDTHLPDDFASLISALQASENQWGFFSVKLSGTHYLFRVIEKLMNWRARLTGIATGDQAMFMYRQTYQEVDGFPEIALMEDIALSRRLKRLSPPLCLARPVVTSSRRWEQYGIINTILKMWWLRLAYFIGVDPTKLAKQYE